VASNRFDATTIPLALGDQMMIPVSANAMTNSSQPGTNKNEYLVLQMILEIADRFNLRKKY
jgi:hypothetical protein